METSGHYAQLYTHGGGLVPADGDQNPVLNETYLLASYTDGLSLEDVHTARFGNSGRAHETGKVHLRYSSLGQKQYERCDHIHMVLRCQIN